MDRKKIEGVSNAIWIPLAWMSLSGSRTVSQWMELGRPAFSVEKFLEGTAVDRAVAIIFLIASGVVLRQRRINWKHLFGENKLL